MLALYVVERICSPDVDLFPSLIDGSYTTPVSTGCGRQRNTSIYDYFEVRGDIPLSELMLQSEVRVSVKRGIAKMRRS